MIVIAPPSSAKSPAFRFATAATIRQQLENARSDKSAGCEFERTWTDDVTLESLIELLSFGKGRGVVALKEEFGELIKSLNQYRSGRGADRERFLRFFDAGPFGVDRKSAPSDKKTIYVPRAFVALTGGIQPGEIVAIMSDEFFRSGFAARLLMTLPPVRKKVWTSDGVDQDSIAALRILTARLFTLKFGRDSDGTQRPNVLPLSEDATSAWAGFHDEHHDQLVGIEDERIRAAFGKLDRYALRFALLLEFLTWAARPRRPLPIEVSLKSLAGALQIVRWIKQETRRVYALFGCESATRRTDSLLEIISHNGGEISVRDLYRRGDCSYRNAAQARHALEALANAGLGTIEKIPHKSGRGRPSIVFVADSSVGQNAETPKRIWTQRHP